jgi:hypothetical protein
LEDTLAQLVPFADRVRGSFHCFANDAATMRRILALGSLEELSAATCATAEKFFR